MLLEVALAQPAAVRSEVGVHRRREVAPVEGIASIFGQPAQRAGERRIAENFALERRAAAGSVGFEVRAGRRGGAVRADINVPHVADELGDGKALLGVADRRREKRGGGQAAEFLMQFEPTVDGPGHGNGQHALHRNFRTLLLCELSLQLGEAQPERRAARRIQAVDFFGFRLVNDGKEIAAGAAVHRLHERERDVGRDGSVDSRSAGFEHIETDLRSERMARANHAVRREHFGARREVASGKAVDLGADGNGGEQRGEQECDAGGRADKARVHRKGAADSRAALRPATRRSEAT